MKKTLLLLIVCVLVFSGCSMNFFKLDTTKIKLIDQVTKKSIIESEVHFREIWDCGEQNSCSPPIIYNGKTNKSGYIFVEKDLLSSSILLLCNGHFNKRIDWNNYLTNDDIIIELEKVKIE